MAKILVTDDSAFLRKRTCSILASTEHTLIQAKDGLDCIEKIAEEQPDAFFWTWLCPI